MDHPYVPSSGATTDLDRSKRPVVLPVLVALAWTIGSALAYQGLGHYPPKSSFVVFAAFPAVIGPAIAIVNMTSADARRSRGILIVGASFLLPNAAVAFVPGLKQLETHPIPGEPTFAVAARPMGNWNLFLIRSSNDGIMQLTDTPQTEGDADLSPDGRQIAFNDDRFGTQDVFVTDLSANDTLSNEHRLTDALGNEEAVTWSPDGAVLLFQHRVDDRADIWTVGASGGPPVALTYDGQSWNPSWSPDGTQIVYAAPNPRDPDNFDIWTMASDGTNSQRLTDVGGDEFRPIWSPDGSLIEFTSDVGGSQDVWVIGVDGTDPRSLTPESPDDDRSYDWSPDARYVLFTSDRSDTGGRFLYFIPAVGGDTQLAVII